VQKKQFYLQNERKETLAYLRFIDFEKKKNTRTALETMELLGNVQVFPVLF
jgi:hypothetical protein